MGWERSERGVRDPRSDAGAAAVEFALLLPIFLVLVLAAIDFALAFRVKIMLHGAAGNGATYAAVSPCDPTTVDTRVRADLPTNDIGHVNYASTSLTTVTVTLLDANGTDVTSSVCTSGATTTGITARVRTVSSYHLLTGSVLGMFGVPADVTVRSDESVRVAGR